MRRPVDPSPLWDDDQHPDREENRMRAIRVTANLHVADLEAAKGFYRDYLGLRDEEFNLGWVARYTAPDSGAHVQLVTRDASAPEDSVISVHTDDVEGAYEEAQRLGYEIVHQRPNRGACAGSSSERPTATSSTWWRTETEPEPLPMTRERRGHVLSVLNV
jgi:predicted enzyme related to lactoylglutathione lyase